MKTKKPLLVVADDQVQRVFLERALSSLPYALTLVNSAREALDAFHKVGHEVVLCDLDLTGELDALELLRHFKESLHPPIVVMLVAENAVYQMIEAVRLGVYDYLRKPAQSNELEATMSRAFARWQSEALARLAEQERAQYTERRLASRRVAEKLVRRQNEKFTRALFGNMFTSFSQGRGVGSLTTLVSMLVGVPLSEDGKHYLVPKEILDLINDNQDAVNAMIATFSELHLLVSQDLVLHDVNLGEFHKIIKDLIFELGPLIAVREHAVVLSELSPRFAGQVLKMNWEFMRKALRELIVNALKFSPESTTVTILMEYRFTRVLITVLNEPLKGDAIETGGIPEEYRRLVFEPFFRLSRAVREEYRTLEYGLGLTLVDKIINMHHGEIRCTSVQNFLAPDATGELVAFEIELPI